jgi:hypothetical protein
MAIGPPEWTTIRLDRRRPTMMTALTRMVLLLALSATASFALDGPDIDRIAVHAASSGPENVRSAVATLREAGYFRGALREQLASETSSRPSEAATADPAAATSRTEATLNNLFPEGVWIKGSAVDGGTGLQALTLVVNAPADPRSAGMRSGRLKTWMGLAVVDPAGKLVSLTCIQPIAQE